VKQISIFIILIYIIQLYSIIYLLLINHLIILLRHCSYDNKTPISKIEARSIFDSRGNPTVEVIIYFYCSVTKLNIFND